MSEGERTAVAWWMEVDAEDRFVCFDTDRGDTVVFDVSDANFGGRDSKMSVGKGQADAYTNRLHDADVICLEVYGTEFVAIVWNDSDHGIIANMRFGSGRHHTGVGIELEKMLERDSIKGVNVVSMGDAREMP